MKLTSLKNKLISLNKNDKLYILLFIIGVLVAVILGTGISTLFIQLINPQVDLKSAAIIVGALLSIVGSLGCFLFYLKK